MTVRFGADALVASPSLLGSTRRVGLVTNDAARLAHDPTQHTRRALQLAGVPLVRLFSPEHGLAATAADGAAVADGMDALTGCPVVSLYGERLRPEASSLEDLSCVLFDVPDVGARFYTYTWTLYHMLAACADAGVPLVVLDRPNPLGGDVGMAEGPLLDPVCRSFVGEDRIPIRHQATLGELARLWQRERFPAAILTVIPCTGWSRTMRWPETGCPWIPTSPSMPSYASAVWYPGICLFEGTNLSVGRGTDAPFQQLGAPWLSADAVCETLATVPLDGVTLEPITFTPTLPPYDGVRCHGIRLHGDPATVRPVAVALQLLTAVRIAHPASWAWARYPTAANPSGEGHLDRLVGRQEIAPAILTASGPLDPHQIAQWTAVGDWGERLAAVALYDGVSDAAA